MNGLYLSIIAVLIAVIGSLITFVIKFDHNRLCALISFAAGCLISVALFVIIPEGFENAEMSYLSAFISIFSGYLLFWLISKYFFHVCPACAASHFDYQTTKKFAETALMMITAFSVHSLFDGIALATGGHQEHLVSSNSHGFENTSIFIAIAIHKLPEGLTLASLMLGAAYKKSKVVLYVALIEMITIVGTVIGYFIMKNSVPEYIINILMLHIGGGFIFLGIHAISGELIKNHRKLVVSCFSGGLFLIAILHVLLH